MARDDTPGMLEARRARAESRAGLISAIDHAAESREIAERVARHGSRNHWGEVLGSTYLRNTQREK